MKLRRIIFGAVLAVLILAPALKLGAHVPTIYYVDQTLGKDTYNGTTTTINDGASEGPWKTIAKVNAASFNAGDSILFKRGETWREQLTVPSSGSAGSVITFGKYGASGADPIISGADIITSWTQCSTTTQLITNGTMEADSSWANQNTPTTNERSTEQVHGGTYSRKFVVDASYEGIKATAFTTTNGMVLTYSIWAYVPGTNKTGFQIVNGAGVGYLLQTFPQSLTANAWNQISGTVTETGAGGSAATVRVISDATSGTYYVDDVSVTYSVVSNAWQKSGITTEPKAVYYNGTKLTQHDGVTTAVSSNEWDWASNVLYVNVGEDPSTHALEISQRNYGIILNQDYVTIDGFTVTKPQNSCIVSEAAASSDYNTIQNCTLTNSPNFGWKAGIVLNHASNNLITHNTVTDCYTGIMLSSYHASASYPTDGNTVSHNTVTRIDMTGISVASGSATSYQLAGNIIESNDVSLCSQTFDDTGGIVTSRAGAGNIIRYNKSYDNGLNNSTMRGTGIMIDENSNGEEVYYNVVYGNSSHGIGTSGDDTLIYNNTLYDNDNGIFLFLSGITSDSPADCIIKNNIVLANGGQGYVLVRTEAVTAGGHVFDNNCYYGSSLEHPFGWNTAPCALDHDWTDWRVHNAEASSIVSDPLVVSTSDFHLQSGSPCRNAGVSVGLTTDYAGNAIGLVPDIGAYEYAAVVPTLAATTAASAITSSAATSGGNVTDSGDATITARGVCWNTSTLPTTANSKTTDAGTTGAYSSSLTGLTRATLYHVRAYATNSVGTAYGAEIDFTALAESATVTTTAITLITKISASSGGNVTDDGGATITARGVCWGTSANPTTANSKTTESGTTGAFTSTLTPLLAKTGYHVRAYATNSIGTVYGADVAFATLGSTRFCILMLLLGIR